MYTYMELKKLTDKQLNKLYRMAGDEIKIRNRRAKKTDKVPFKPGGRVRNWRIYVLMLSGGKYYVGVTAQTVQKRYAQHVDGTGAKWTKRHKPIGIIDKFEIGRMSESEAVKLETQKTLEVIEQYGIENVRGGSLVRVDQAKVTLAYNRLLKIHAKAQLSGKG